MLYSQKHNFLYISVPKTGSTNFQANLLPFSDMALLRAGINTNSTLSNHSCVRKFFESFPEDVVGHPFTFSIIREPFSRFISEFNYRSRLELCNPEHKNHCRSVRNISFDEYLTRLEDDPTDIYKQSDLLFLANGDCIDAILRLENIVEDIKSIRHLLPADFNIDNCFSIRRNESKDLRMSLEKLTTSDKNRITNLYEKDFELYYPLHKGKVRHSYENGGMESVDFSEWMTKNNKHIAAESYYAMGTHWRSKSMDSEALKAFEYARYLDPEIKGMSGMMASIYRKIGAIDEWNSEVKRILCLSENDTDSAFEAGQWFYENDDFDRAYAQLFGSLKYSSGTPKDYLLLARLVVKQIPDNKTHVLLMLKEGKDKYLENTFLVNHIEQAINKIG